MPLNLRRRLMSAFSRRTILQNLTFLFCVLFGLAMILNTQTAGDGTWYWYAVFLRSGRHLYSGMHLALQPLFVLETSALLGMLGKGWLVSKIPGALHVVAYCLGLLLLARSSKLPDWQKALVLAFAFFVSVGFPPYRFDDYHVLADCFQVYSIVILLSVQKAWGEWRRDTLLVVVLGVLSGLSMMTRLNDGGALFVGVAIVLVCTLPSRRLVALTVFSVTTAVMVVAVVHLTGDSLHDWSTYSIFQAAGSKGGARNVLVYPFLLPWHTLRFLRDRQNLEFVTYVVGSAGIWALFILPFLRTRRRSDLWKALAGATVILLPLHHFLKRRGPLVDQTMLIDLSAVGVLLTYGFGLVVFARAAYRQFAPEKLQRWNRPEILLIIPLGQLASASMSSAGLHVGLYGPVAITALLLPIASPIHLRRQWSIATTLAVALLLTCECVVYKIMEPYHWHSYKVGPLFVGREWYTHPQYGPMLIEPDLLHFVQPICANIGKGEGSQELLSLPFPYPNYFCSIEPWHGYVQTFFDTSSSETIFGLMDELEKAPPKWIIYQRQLKTLEMHEGIFNHGNPLPHRYLDWMIERKIASGAWRPVYTSTFGLGNEWVLLQTRP